MIRAELAVAAIALVASGAVASAQAHRFGRAYHLGPQRVSCLFGREWPVSGIPLSKASRGNVGGRCTSWLSSLPR